MSRIAVAAEAEMVGYEPETVMDHFGYERILVATDLSQSAAPALRYAALLRERLGSSVTLLYADEAHFPLDIAEAPLGYYLDQAPEHHDRMKARLESAAAAHFSGGGVAAKVVRGAPARVITDTARELDADLVVMGTHGRSGWRRALLGSVAEAVLHESDRPVITVTAVAPVDDEPMAIRRVICPVNFTFIARESLHHASAIAQAFDAELIVVYVAEHVGAPQLPEVEAAFGIWADPAVRGRARYRLAVLQDEDPAAGVLELVREEGADLIVLGAQHRFFSDATVIGTTTQRITRFARCPVMTVVRRARAEIHVHEAVEELVEV